MKLHNEKITISYIVNGGGISSIIGNEAFLGVASAEGESGGRISASGGAGIGPDVSAGCIVAGGGTADQYSSENSSRRGISSVGTYKLSRVDKNWLR